MGYIFALVASFCLFHSSFAQTPGNANEFIDNMLEQLSNNPEATLDPMIIEDKVIGFTHTVLKGEMKLHNGVLTGLSTMRRAGDCTLVYEAGVMQISAKLGMGVLHAKSTANINFMGVGPSATFNVEVGYAEIDLGLSIDISQINAKPNLTRFKLNQLKGLKVKLSGLGPLNLFFNFFSNLVTNTFRLTIKTIAEKVVAGIVKKKIATMKFPGI